MLKFWGRRGVAAVLGSMLLVSGSGSASAQTASTWKLSPSAPTVGTSTVTAQAAVATAASAMTSAIRTVSTRFIPAPASVATEAAWLRSAGWPLYALVDRFAAGAPLDEQAQCIAVAVYHEARGESLEGQLAVARVIMNRASSGKYPSSWCGTVKQPWQFSFVNPRTGVYPAVNEQSAAWRKALGITRLAVANAVPTLENDVLWYHADYVAPSWGRRLSRVQKIGTHIFYRAA